MVKDQCIIYIFRKFESSFVGSLASPINHFSCFKHDDGTGQIVSVKLIDPSVQDTAELLARMSGWERDDLPSFVSFFLEVDLRARTS